jgi:hypothetical protein
LKTFKKEQVKMSTRSRIKLMHNGKALGAIYYAMDGHIWNFAPPLIKALKATTPANILSNKHLIKLMGANALNAYGERDEHLDYLCEVDISQSDYVITTLQTVYAAIAP